MAKVTTNQKGAKVLTYQGYSYNFAKNGVGKKIWLCKDNRHQRCLGRLHSAEEVEDGILVEVLKEPSSHNHAPDAAFVEKAEVLRKLKVTAATSNDSTASVVAAAIQGTSVACLGTDASQQSSFESGPFCLYCFSQMQGSCQS